MNYSKVLDFLVGQQEYYRDAFSLVHKILKNKVYKLSLNITARSYDLKTDRHISEETFVQCLVTPIAYNSESLRFKVVAGDFGVTSHGRRFELSTDKHNRGGSLDRITLKYTQLIKDTTTIEEAKAEDMPLYIGCKFIHPDFRKHMEAI